MRIWCNIRCVAYTWHVFVLLEIKSDFKPDIAASVTDYQILIRFPVEYETSSKVRVHHLEIIWSTLLTSKFATDKKERVLRKGFKNFNVFWWIRLMIKESFCLKFWFMSYSLACQLKFEKMHAAKRKDPQRNNNAPTNTHFYLYIKSAMSWCRFSCR